MATYTETAGNAGLRITRRSRSTGQLTSLYDGELAGMDTDGGRWQTVCETHGTVISHETYALALGNLGQPDQWCEPCMWGVDDCTELDAAQAAAQ